MTTEKMNEKQKKAFKNIKHAANFIIGGYENDMLDYRPQDDVYKKAQRILADHGYLVDLIYNEAISCVYGVGYCNFSKDAERYLKDIRFCGKEYLLDLIDERVKSMGY